MKTIDVSGITPTLDIDIKGRQILDLIGTYIPGFLGRYYGYLNIGRSDITFPAIFVEPLGADFPMITTGKTLLWVEYALEWYVIDNNSADALSLCTSAADALKKLFSNNALSDIGSGNTNKFKNNPGYWIYSEIQNIEIGRSLRSAVPQSEDKYMRAGRMRLRVQDTFVA